MKRALSIGVVSYLALVLVCSLGLAAIPERTQGFLRPYLWLLGPPANLVHGTKFLVPFVTGTFVLGGLVLGVSRSESPVVQLFSAVALVLVWAAFGFIAYAPGM